MKRSLLLMIVLLSVASSCQKMREKGWIKDNAPVIAKAQNVYNTVSYSSLALVVNTQDKLSADFTNDYNKLRSQLNSLYGYIAQAYLDVFLGKGSTRTTLNKYYNTGLNNISKLTDMAAKIFEDPNKEFITSHVSDQLTDLDLILYLSGEDIDEDKLSASNDDFMKDQDFKAQYDSLCVRLNKKMTGSIAMTLEDYRPILDSISDIILEKFESDSIYQKAVEPEISKIDYFKNMKVWRVEFFDSDDPMYIKFDGDISSPLYGPHLDADGNPSTTIDFNMSTPFFI